MSLEGDVPVISKKAIIALAAIVGCLVIDPWLAVAVLLIIVVSVKWERS